jgi:hypothetical protein
MPEHSAAQCNTCDSVNQFPCTHQRQCLNFVANKQIPLSDNQVNQVGVWLDKDTGPWCLELGEELTFRVVDDKASYPSVEDAELWDE